MGLYEDNLRYIECYDELLYRNYLTWNESEQTSESVVTQAIAFDGDAYLNIEKNRKLFRMNSCYSPVNEAQEWSSQFFLNNIKQTITMFGMGNGCFLSALKKACRSDAQFVVYEPEIEVFDYLMNNVNMEVLLGDAKIYFIVRDLNEDHFYDAIFNSLMWNNMSYLIVTEHPQYRNIYPQDHAHFCIKVREGLENARINRNTTAYFGQEHLKNMIATIPYLRRAQFFEQYRGKFEGAPAIIVSAGPSLDINVELLREAKGKAVIIAVDTAMKRLTELGIYPDFMINVDPIKPISYLGGEKAKDIPLFCCDTSNREILRMHEAQKILFDVTPFIERLKPDRYSEHYAFGTGGSVANSAFSLCHQLKFSTIILIGQDLAYKDGASHAGKEVLGEAQGGIHHVEVEDIFGNMVASRDEWKRFLVWFENAIAKVSGEIEVIDATEGGAKIGGTKIMTLREAIDTFCTGSIDCEALVKNTPPGFDDEEYALLEKELHGILNDIDKTKKDVDEIKVSLKQLCKQCEKELYDKKYKQLVDKVLKLGERIKERKSYILMASWTSQKSQFTLGNINKMSDNVKENELWVYRKSLEFYEDFYEAASEVKLVLEDALEQI